MKLGALPIIMIGIAISVAMLSYAFFDNFLPNNAEAKMYRDYKEALDTEGNKRGQAQKRVDAAAAQVNQAAAAWRQIVAARTPPNNVADGGIDLGVNPWQLVFDAKRYRNSIQLAVNEQVKKGGIKLPNGGPTIPDPGGDQQTILSGFFNYPAVAFPVVVFDLGQITVTGTYDQIVANYEAWQQMPRYMALVDGLQFTGTSPNLTATYNVQLLGYIKANDIFPPAPEASLAAAPARGGGGGGAPGGGQGPGQGAGIGGARPGGGRGGRFGG